MTADEKNEEVEETVEETGEPEAEAKPKKAAKKRATRRKKAEAEVEETPAEDDTSDDAEDAEPAAKKAGRRRGAAETTTRTRTRRPRGDAEPVSVRAQAKFVRTAPRKARLVVDHIRGKTVEEARAILAHTPRAAAEPILKVLESAVANAEHNHELLPEELRVEQVFVDEGPTLKRFRPRAQGRATRIRKRTSHITIKVTNAS